MSLRDVPPVLPGETLAGKYRVERVLGQGGMGIVLAARHLELDERVAIKFLLGERAPAAVERFLREARAAAKVKSEHVCRVFDVGRLESGEPFMVMEHLEGIDLGHKLEEGGPLEAELAASLVIEACVALAEAHAAGIVHRDLKPANMFLADRPDGTTCVKLLDFGISKAPSIAEITSTAVMMGSPLYMSPEQITSSRSVDARADIWSLGIVLFELVAGEPPFVADSMVQLSVKVREQEPRTLAELGASAPDGFEEVIARCLAKRPADRYPSVKELAVDLARFASPDAAHLAGRIGRTRRPSHSDPALMATARATPASGRRLESAPESEPAVESSPRSAPSSEPRPPEESAGTSGVEARQEPAPFGRATFAPLQTTMRRAESRARRQWRMRMFFGVVVAGALAWGALRLPGSGVPPATPVETASAASTSPAAPPVLAARAPETPAFDAAPEEAAPAASLVASAPSIAEPKAAPPARRDATRVPPRPTTSAPAPTSPAAEASASVAPPPPVASAPPEATATPHPGVRKKRSLDRTDPY